MTHNTPGVNRDELIQRMVLNVIGDGLESLDWIVERVTTDGTDAGISVSEVEISKALIYLLSAGLASAFRVFPTRQPPELIEAVPHPEDMARWHYLMTEKGLVLHESDYKDWPFDDDGKVRKDWTPVFRD